MAGRTSRRITNESGTILVVMAAVCVALTVLFAGVCELGRYLLLRERTQTAADAAALAASLSGVQRWVKVDVYTDRGETLVCICGDDGCSCWCEPCGITVKTVTGKEKELIDDEGWKDYCDPPCSCGGGSCWYDIVDRWVVYNEGSAEQTMEAFYVENQPTQGSGSWIFKSVIHKDKNDPYYPSLTVYGRTVAQSLFPNLFGVFPDEYKTDVCAQGGTFYKDPKTEKWVKAPPRACWND